LRGCRSVSAHSFLPSSTLFSSRRLRRGGNEEVYTMATVKTILEIYERTGSYRQTGRELGVSHNTVRKYVLRAQAARDGVIEEIFPQDREIHQPGRVVTPEIQGTIYRILEKNRKKPKKRRCNAKLIWRHLITSGHSLSYSTVKREVARWRTEQGLP